MRIYVGFDDMVHTKGWLRPRLWGNRAVLLVAPSDEGVWESIGGRRNKEKETVTSTFLTIQRI